MMNGGGNDDNDTKQSALSPLVTAQDRKRMILERRRKEREQQSRDDSLLAAPATNPIATSRSSFNSLKRQRNDSSRATKLFSNDENITPKAGDKSTLFGAVMQRTSSASTPTKQRSALAAGVSTPNNRVAWNAEISTPSSSRSKSFLSANSPCGLSLLKVLESVASPFRHKEDGDEEGAPEESPDAAKIEEWQESYLHSNTVGIVDWSIKRKLRLECHPASCLPTAFDWQDALSYWQHPAMYPLPTFEGDENDQSTKEVSATMLPSTPNMSDMVRGRDAILHRLCRQDPGAWKQRRNREWQEAFRSLYFKWIQQVEALQQNVSNLSAQSVTQTCFYAMGPGHTILFRTGLETASGDKPQVVPLIVLSSTTLQMRSKLRDMGAKLFYYHDRNAEFDEAVLERNKPKKKVNKDETEAVHEELEALRRAQARGETAGADVSIATKTKAVTKSPCSVPPLCLIGDDDCATFFEFYLNTLGGRCRTWIKGKGDVPLLLSRKVGPFVHASMQSLVVSSRRQARQSHEKSGDQEHHHAAIELRGPILPCATEEILCYTASRMIRDVEGKSGAPSRQADDVGSHYFVVQAQPHDGDEYPNTDSATTGTAGSRWLNDGSEIYENLSSNDDKPSGCELGEVVRMVVWDIARPKMIAYKSDPRPS